MSKKIASLTLWINFKIELFQFLTPCSKNKNVVLSMHPNDCLSLCESSEKRIHLI